MIHLLYSLHDISETLFICVVELFKKADITEMRSLLFVIKAFSRRRETLRSKYYLLIIIHWTETIFRYFSINKDKIQMFGIT